MVGGWKTPWVSIYSVALLMKNILTKPFLILPRSRYQMEVCLLGAKYSSLLGIALNPSQECTSHSAAVRMPATRMQLCVHGLEGYALAALNSSPLHQTIQYEVWTTSFQGGKKLGILKGNFPANLLFSKCGSGLKYHIGRWHLSPLWDARWCFWLTDPLCSEYNFPPKK